jgi:hypothetical protein
MVQGRGSFRLTAKTLQGLHIFGHIFRQELQGHKTVKAGIFGFIHYTHPSTAQLLDDAVMRDGLADELGWSDH